MAYGVNFSDMFRRDAVFVGKILLLIASQARIVTRDGQCELEDGAVRIGRRRPQPSSMRFDDSAADR
jgi:hypothetical protein